MTLDTREPNDPVGLQTVIANAESFDRRMCDQIGDHLKGEMLEIRSRISNISNLIIESK